MLLNVKFSGEYGVDAGGLSREFMRLSLKEIKNLPIFSGTEQSKVFSLDYKG